MPVVKKLPYYTMERSFFRRKVWTEYAGSSGAVPILTSQTISYERLAPNAPVPPKPTKEQLQAMQLEGKNKNTVADQPSQPTPPPATKTAQTKTVVLDAEEKEKLPVFDLQDIPSALDKIGWPISAKVARKWFSSPKHIWDNDPNSEQPIDDSIVTLNWALKYEGVREKFNELLHESIYSPSAVALIKEKIVQHASTAFRETESSKPNLSLNTSVYTKDLRKFHMDWQFQRNKVSTLDTFDGRLMTDISGALGNFLFYAALGKVEVFGEKYFDYRTNPYQYCIDAVAQLTHVYIYLKDNYSFNDKDPSKSQYLGHWNKKDMILAYMVAANDLLGQFKPSLKSKYLNDSEAIEKTNINWDYLITRKEVDKPVDKRTGFFRKFLEKDVYWPVYNKSYNEWREKHGRGGDFMIYSKPQLYKLKTPITIKLGTLCRPYNNTLKNQ
jgi:hypothetical protein